MLETLKTNLQSCIKSNRIYKNGLHLIPAMWIRQESLTPCLTPLSRSPRSRGATAKCRFRKGGSSDFRERREQNAEFRFRIKSASESKRNLFRQNIGFDSALTFRILPVVSSHLKLVRNLLSDFRSRQQAKTDSKNRRFVIMILLWGECYRPAEFRFRALKRRQNAKIKMICPRLAESFSFSSCSYLQYFCHIFNR